jgi:hypothetical protein
MDPYNQNEQPQQDGPPRLKETTRRREKAADEICWQAADNQVSLIIKARPRRRPQSDYPVLVMALRPREHTRIQELEDHPGGVEALLTFQEIEELIIAVNRIGKLTGKGELYRILQRIPPKDARRKRMWDRNNAAFHRRKWRRN